MMLALGAGRPQSGDIGIYAELRYASAIVRRRILPGVTRFELMMGFFITDAILRIARHTIAFQRISH